MIPYNNKYEYKHYTKHTGADGKRVYQIGEQSLPSVTTILSATKPKEDVASLARWRKGVGEEEANRIVKKSVGIGNQLHDNLEFYLREEKTPEGPPLVKIMTKVMIKKGLSNLNEWWGAECPLFYDGLYAGTTDLTGVYKNIPAILDFKNSRKKKKLEWITDYRCQLAAYALAHNNMFGTNIKAGVILMVTRACEFEEFVIDGKLFDESVEWWLNRLDQYYG